MGKEVLDGEMGGRTWLWVECRAAAAFRCVGEEWSEMVDFEQKRFRK